MTEHRTVSDIWNETPPRTRAKIIRNMIREEMPKARRDHLRKARLEAYKRRHQWRKADIPRLLRMGVNPQAQRRIERLLQSKSSGRGVIREYKNLDDYFRALVDFFRIFDDPTTSSRTRLALFKSIRVWPSFVESMYRGELTAAEEGKRHLVGLKYGREKPSDIAEQAVAEAIGMSTASVHALCDRVRKKHNRPDGPPMNSAYAY